MDPLLRLADDLERRDERAAAELGEVERLGREVERTRAEAESTAAFLAALPEALAALSGETRAAEAARAEAAGAVAAAEEDLRRARERRREDERLTAARAVQHARDALQEAELRARRALAERARLEAEGEERRVRAAALEREAEELAAQLAALPRVAREAVAAPGSGLDGVLAWAAQARGGLLVAAAAIATERERVGREAAELVTAVSGDPLALAGAAGLRDRVERALRRE